MFCIWKLTIITKYIKRMQSVSYCNYMYIEFILKCIRNVVKCEKDNKNKHIIIIQGENYVYDFFYFFIDQNIILFLFGNKGNITLFTTNKYFCFFVVFRFSLILIRHHYQ